MWGAAYFLKAVITGAGSLHTSWRFRSCFFSVVIWGQLREAFLNFRQLHWPYKRSHAIWHLSSTVVEMWYNISHASEFRAICKREKSDFLAPLSRHFENTGVGELSKTAHKKQDKGAVQTNLKQIFCRTQVKWYLSHWLKSFAYSQSHHSIISATNIRYFNFVVCFGTLIIFTVQQNNFILQLPFNFEM